jgi:4-hydroxy-tetrahydrodipicolinate synthase
MLFEGSGVAIITPFLEDGSVDFEGFETLVNFQIDNGTDALIVLGTTGEATTMTEEERLQLVENTIEIVEERVPIIVGTGSNNTQETIDFSQKIDQLDVDGIMVVTPYYNKATDKGLYEHFRVIAEAVELPMIMYNVPSRTNMTIPVETVRQLSEIDNIVGLKDATSDLAYTANVRRVTPSDFAIYSGNDDTVVPLMSVGGSGVISVLANIMPKEMHEMTQLYLDGQTKEAGQMQVELMPAIASIFTETNPVPVKAAGNLMGLPAGHLRLPLYEAEDATKENLREVLAEWDLI